VTINLNLHLIFKNQSFHIHLPDSRAQSKFVGQGVQKFMEETLKEKKVTPKEMQEKLKDKFDKDFDYQVIANTQKNLS